MNLVYGASALFISYLVVSFGRRMSGSTIKVLAMVFMIELISVCTLAVIFYMGGWGFFSAGLDLQIILTKVIGLAVFLSVLVSFKVFHQRKGSTG